MTTHPSLSAWETFYVIVGSSAAALTGLQFVVIALVAQIEMRTDSGEVAAFGTPNVVHFSAVLLISAILSAPWPALNGAAVAIMTCGVAGILYTLITAYRARRTQIYKPVLEDWIWHVVLPLAAYVILAVAGGVAPRYQLPGLFGIAAAALLLLGIGIHNSWDTVTYITVDVRRANAARSSSAPEATAAPSVGEHGA